MNYEQKYKMALERAKDIIEDLRKGEDILAVSELESIFVSELESMFPELKESEDERIRKEIIEFIKTNSLSVDERQGRWLAWLEKQGEPQEDKVKPKFKED